MANGRLTPSKLVFAVLSGCTNGALWPWRRYRLGSGRAIVATAVHGMVPIVLQLLVRRWRMALVKGGGVLDIVT